MAQLASFAVEVLTFDGCIAAEVFAVADMLSMANSIVFSRNAAAVPPFAVSIISTAGRSVQTSAGVMMTTRKPSRFADMLIVPGFAFTNGDHLLTRLAELTEVKLLITCRARSKTKIGSTCVGAFLLADAGVLDGRRATTAWIVAGVFERRFPKVRLDVDRMIIRDGRVWTTGAVTAAYDLALELVREHCGPKTSALLAKIALIGTDRTLQSPFVLADLGATSSDLVGRACHKIRRDIDQSFNLNALANYCGTSTRTLNRRFQAELKCTPLAFAHKVKVERAKSLLETTRIRIGELPGRLGYVDETTFRMIFERHTGLTPQTYRRRFGRQPNQHDSQ